MTYQNDGGPAFPARPTEHIAGGFTITAHHGMSLRAYLAAHTQPFSNDCHSKVVEVLAGRPYGATRHGSLEHWRFWADVEAAWRVMQADAILRALAGEKPNE
jgi:hypothetical protein